MKNKTALFLFLAIPFLAMASGSALLYRVTYGLVFLVLLGYLWSRFNVRGLKAEVHRVTLQAQAGQWLEEKVVVHNTGWLPKFLLEVHHKTDLPGHNNRRVVHILPNSSITWIAKTLCQRRGLFSFGRVSVAAQDPFGLFSCQSSLGQPSNILVYPNTLELSDFLLPTGKALGGGYQQGRTDSSSPSAFGVREYVLGDSFSRIHWRSTARMRRLMVKDFDRELAGPSGEVWIMLDMQAEVQRGQGSESTSEYGITIAASIARKYMNANRGLGLIAWGDKHYFVPAQRGIQQWGRILEALALVQAQGQAPLAEVVSYTLEQMGPNAVAVVITSASRESLRAPFNLLGERKVTPVAILLDAASFGGYGDSSTTVEWFTSAGVEAYVVRKGEGIEKALDSRMKGWSGTHGTAFMMNR